MKNSIVILLASLFLTACGQLGPKEANANAAAAPATPAAPAAKFKVGETVVAKWAQNSFYEGTAEAVTDAKVKVKWSDGSNPTDVDAADVFALPKPGAKPDVKAGDIVLAKTASGSYWNGAEIASVEGEVYAVKTVNGQTSNVSAEKIIAIPAAVAANFRDQSKSADFLKLAQSKKPVETADFKPKEGETVLGEWTTNSWYQAKVQKTGGAGATLAWEDGSKPSELPLAKIRPLPTAKTPLPKAGGFVLVRPESGTKWVYAQVVAVKDSAVEIKTAEGRTRNLKAGDFVELN